MFFPPSDVIPIEIQIGSKNRPLSLSNVFLGSNEKPSPNIEFSHKHKDK